MSDKTTPEAFKTKEEVGKLALAISNTDLKQYDDIPRSLWMIDETLFPPKFQEMYVQTLVALVDEFIEVPGFGVIEFQRCERAAFQWVSIRYREATGYYDRREKSHADASAVLDRFQTAIIEFRDAALKLELDQQKIQAGLMTAMLKGKSLEESEKLKDMIASIFTGG